MNIEQLPHAESLRGSLLLCRDPQPKTSRGAHPPGEGRPGGPASQHPQQVRNNKQRKQISCGGAATPTLAPGGRPADTLAHRQCSPGPGPLPAAALRAQLSPGMGGAAEAHSPPWWYRAAWWWRAAPELQLKNCLTLGSSGPALSPGPFRALIKDHFVKHKRNLSNYPCKMPTTEHS